MTIEEKAKAYDKALSKAREYYFQGQDPDKLAELESMFPVLKESEDESIRKALLRCCDDWDKGQFGCMKKEDVPLIRAYLEKKKEPLTPEEKMNHPLYLEGFDVGRQVGEVVKKPEKWNDADDKIQRNLMTLLSCMRGDRIAEATYKKYYPWLRDLPKRFSLQKNAEWSEEDEKNWNEYIERLKAEYSKTPNVVLWDDINWLEYLHERLKSLRPQPKAELSLLDENIINAAIAFVEQNDHFNCWRGIDKHTVIKALRSIKPYWKPSEEQMKHLKSISVGWHPDLKDCQVLSSLYKDLEKL
jgi:hypothetical protein